MTTTAISEHTVLRSGETTIVVEYGADGHARLDVTANRYGPGSADVGRLACEAIHQARLRNADRVDGALDAASPTCGAILEALHREVGHDLDSIAMRRAGSSVMVVLEMHPVATPTYVPTAATTSFVPTQPSRSGRSGWSGGGVLDATS